MSQHTIEIISWIGLGFVVGLGVAGGIWGWICEAQIRIRNKKIRTMSEALEENAQRFLEIANSMNREIERGVEKRIREWSPDPTTIEEDFKKAEYMARHREASDAHRSYPPRDDGGPRARVSRMTLRR